MSFDNDSARNNIILGVDNSSSSHADNLKINFLVIGEGPILVLMEVLAQQRKSLILILVKQTQNLSYVCIIMLIIVICLLIERNL